MAVACVAHPSVYPCFAPPVCAQRRLQLSQLLPSSTFAKQPDFLVTTLEVRVASVCREFSLDQFAEDCNLDAFERAACLIPSVSPLALVQGIVLPLALDGKGCRLVQDALEKLDNANRRELIAELKGHVCEALDSPHANHVLQRVIELVPPNSVQFILDELASSWDMSSVVQHRFGCRLLERIFEHFTACESSRLALDFYLVNGAFGDLTVHCFHMFGTHVMQHLMEYGSYEQQQLVCQALRMDLRKAALDEFAVGVLDKALTYLPKADQQAIAQEILQHEGLLPRMAMCWRGQPAAERVLRVVEGVTMTTALTQILANQQALKRSKGGRTLLTMANRKSQ